MSSLSVMEWNAKTPSQWEWDNLISFGTKANKNPKKLQSADWWMDGIEGAVSGLSYSPGGGAGGSGGSRSDLGYTSSAKSSKSPSVGSPSIGEMKTSQPYCDSIEGIPEEFLDRAKIEMNSTSPTVEASVGSGEPLLSLKLGKQAYFEDSSGRSTAKSSSYSVIPVPSLASTKRFKSSSLNTNPPRCQVEGCNLDLSSAKDYHRKHRVCESHSKSPKVTVAGLERRFCQQCSRFHGLSEFDEKKRSCRKRLSDHNARRRKPQPEAVQLNSSSLASSFSDGRQPVSLVWNKIPLFHSKPGTNISWGSTADSRFMQPVKTVKTEGNDGQLSFLSTGASNNTATVCHNPSGFYPSKGTYEVLSQGLPTMTSNLDTVQDLHRALSLLSTSSRASCEPKPVSLDHDMCANPSTMPQSAVVHTLAESPPVMLSDYWQNQRTEPQVPSLDSRNYSNGNFHDFSQQRSTYEGAFNSWQFD